MQLAQLERYLVHLKDKMTTDHKNDEINKGFGIGVGLVLSGIFMLNIPYFFTNISSFSNALLDIFGVAFFIIGILGVLIELGKKEGNAWLDDFGIGVFIFLSVFIPFILIHNSIIKSIFALLSILGFIFLGYALGTSFLDDDGGFNDKTVNYYYWYGQYCISTTGHFIIGKTPLAKN